MKKIIIPILLGFALVAVSCEDRLDIPQKGTVSTTNFYASDADAEAALTNMYHQYAENVSGTPGIYNPENIALNYSADDIYAAGNGYADHEDFRYLDEFKYDDAYSSIKEVYQRYYYAIYHANLVISNFTTENRNEAEPKFTSSYTEQCVAEARVMRAYLHMQAALLFCQPPLMDRVYEGDEMPPVNTDKTQEEILQWVVDECEKAIASGKLPKRNGPNDKDGAARMTVGFAQFVAGKAAMFKNDPATARKYLGDLINSGNYSLVPSEDFWTLFHVEGDGCSEKIFEVNYTDNPAITTAPWARWSKGCMRDRWMVANVFNWRTGSLASVPAPAFSDGWGGGAIQENFAEKFYQHDGDSPRRKASFLTEDEFLYELDWNGSSVNSGSMAEKKADPGRGIAVGGFFARGKYFEWKHMMFVKVPKILAGDKTYPADNAGSNLGENSNQTNWHVARYAEALLLYAEACIGSSDEAKGLKALQDVQRRSGSGKVSSSLTFDAVMEEKQYELWFEGCRFTDLVRWSKQGKVNLDQVFNKANGGIHKNVPTVHDEFFEDTPNKGKEHKLYVTHDAVPGNSDFVVGKHEYLPFPRDSRVANKNLFNVGGWAYLNDTAPAEGE